MKKAKKSAKKNTKTETNFSGITLRVKPIALGAEIPGYNYETDVGFDLRANESVRILPGEQKPVKTGLVFQIPEGHVGLIRDRAGIVQQMGVHTTAGTFDPGYRGEVSILLVNLSEETRFIEQGMRIAQMIIIPVVKPKILETEKLSETKRGEKGFCSTGMKDIEDLNKLMKTIKKKK